jgi:NAD(P)-dependent dehydrogenase (short-subunit alcohol dehydrogenase family)
LKDKVVLITGAGRGLGKALAVHLAAQGARMVVNDINPDTAEATVKEISEAGGQAIHLSADVANKMAVQTLHYEILEKWGRVDVLINNAAIEPLGPLLTTDEWAWDRAMNVNLKGAFLCTQTVARGMKEQGGGVILNIGGWETGHEPHAAFVASKEGLAGFTRECAKELAGYGIRVEVMIWTAHSEISVIVNQTLARCSLT